MKKSVRQKHASGNLDIIGKLILGKELLQKMIFSLALYQIWEYICGRNLNRGIGNCDIKNLDAELRRLER